MATKVVKKKAKAKVVAVPPRGRDGRLLPGYVSERLAPYAFKKGNTLAKQGGHARNAAGITLTATLKRMLKEPASRVPHIADIAEAMELDPRNTEIGAVLVMQIINHAIMGKSDLLVHILDRCDGKVKEVIEQRTQTLSDMVRGIANDSSNKETEDTEG